MAKVRKVLKAQPAAKDLELKGLRDHKAPRDLREVKAAGAKVHRGRKVQRAWGHQALKVRREHPELLVAKAGVRDRKVPKDHREFREVRDSDLKAHKVHRARRAWGCRALKGRRAHRELLAVKAGARGHKALKDHRAFRAVRDSALKAPKVHRAHKAWECRGRKVRRAQQEALGVKAAVRDHKAHRAPPE